MGKRRMMSALRECSSRTRLSYRFRIRSKVSFARRGSHPFSKVSFISPWVLRQRSSNSVRKSVEFPNWKTTWRELGTKKVYCSTEPGMKKVCCSTEPEARRSCYLASSTSTGCEAGPCVMEEGLALSFLGDNSGEGSLERDGAWSVRSSDES